MSKRSGFYPCPAVDGAGTQVVSQAGAVLLTVTLATVGLDRVLSTALGPWRPRWAVHDPAKVLLDLALGLAIGGDCLADVGVLRAEPDVFGRVASDPTVSRTIDRLADDADKVLAAVEGARAAARATAWRLAGDRAPDHGTDAGRPLVIDVDATLVTAHSEKEGAAATFKRGFGHHPLWAFVDHGPAGTGEPVAALLRPGNAGSNTAGDHLTVIRAALRQLPGYRAGRRPGKKVLIRVDGAGATHELLDWLAAQRLSYSVGFGLTQAVVDQLAGLPERAWQPAYNAGGEPRPGAWVIEATGLMAQHLAQSGWPKGMRVIVGKERPHPGAQLRSPTPTGIATPPSPPTPPPAVPGGSSPTWSCVTAAAPGPRTASAPRRTPGCATCPCTGWTKTGSGRPSSRWPATSPPGPRCLPSPSIPPAAGSPSGCGCGSSPCPPTSPITPAPSCCTCPPPHPGRTSRSPA